MPGFKKIASRVFLLLIGLFLVFSITEIRVFLCKYKTKIGQRMKGIKTKVTDADNVTVGSYDSELGWSFKKGAINRVVSSEFDVVYLINSQGIRDKDILKEKPLEEFRVIALGESTVFGEGVNYGERFTEIIEKVLIDVEVVNMGVRGFGVDQSFLQLRRDGFDYNPDLIVLFAQEFFLERSKDFIRTGMFKPRFVVSENRERLLLEKIDFLKKRFAYEKALVNKIEEKQKKKNVLRNFEQEGGRAERRWKDLNEQLEITKKHRKSYKEEDYRRLLFLLFRKYKNVCRKHNVEFLIVNMGRNKIDYLDKICSELELSYLDLAYIMEHASQYKSLNFEIDPHYNEFAHEVIGEYVAEYIGNNYNIKEKDNYDYKFLGKL